MLIGEKRFAVERLAVDHDPTVTIVEFAIVTLRRTAKIAFDLCCHAGVVKFAGFFDGGHFRNFPLLNEFRHPMPECQRLLQINFRNVTGTE